MRAWLASLTLALLAAGTGLALDPPPPYFDDAEIDDTGNVWALSRAEYNQLFVFDGRGWTVISVPFADGVRAMPAGLGRFDDGAVACIWRLSEDTMAVSRHSGKESNILIQAPGNVPGSGLAVQPFCDSRNRLWITGKSPQVDWIDGKGARRRAYELTDSDMVNPGQKHVSFNPVMAAEDGSGRVWIWTNTRAGGSNHSSIDGILFCDGDRMERKTLPGLEGKLFGPIIRLDSRQMIVAVIGDGLYEVDADTLESRRLEDPEEKAFCCAQNLFVSQGDLHVVTAHRSPGKLWRKQNGTWKLLIGEVDRNSDANRPWLADGVSLILGASPSPWLVRKNAPPERLTWANGFPVEGIRNLFRLPDGRVFALGQGGKIFCGKINPVAVKSRLTELDVRFGCAFDASGRVWCVEGEHKNILREWNGREWRSHPFPGGFSEKGIASLSADEQGRIWLLPRAPDGPCLVFDSGAEKWRDFPTIQGAFESFISDPPRFIESSGWPPSAVYFRPLYHGKRITYRPSNSSIAYFDGTSWRVIKRKEIQDSDGKTTNGQPFFDAAGHLCVNIGEDTWQLQNDGKWTRTKPEERYPDEFSSGTVMSSANGITVIATTSRRPELPLPDGATADSINSVVQDNHGAYWFLSRSVLHKAIPGGRVRVFAAAEPNPFDSPRLLNNAFVDPAGYAFLQTSSAGGSWFMLSPKNPPPQVAVTVTSGREGVSEARFEPGPAPDRKILWQFNDGPWIPASNDKVELEGLANGRHAVRVRALTEDLVFGPIATAEFESQQDTEQQIATLIERLGDPDFAKRETAVKALLRQPGTALPALRAARDEAPASHRWWIDATLQEMESQSKRK